MNPLDVINGGARWCLVHGDNREVLPGLPDGSVAHVITDPPYEAAAHTLQRRVNDKAEKSEYGKGNSVRSAPLGFAPIDSSARGFCSEQFARLAVRWVIAFCQIEAATKWADLIDAAGSTTRRIGVWVKPGAMPQFSGDRPGMGFETIVFCHRKGRSKWNGGGRVGVFEHTIPDGLRVHETQKPLALMLELVELFTDPGDIVLDPFAGSGTTGVACLRLGRRFIGVEKSEVYAKVATERLRAEEQGLSLRAARAGQLPMFGVP